MGLNAARRERGCVLPAHSAEMHLLAMPYRPGWLQLGRLRTVPNLCSPEPDQRVRRDAVRRGGRP